MGLKLNPAILKDQAQSIIDNLKEDNQGLLHALETIEQFTGNTDLKSVAWDNMKAQLSNHEAVIQGLICANDMVIQNSVTLCGSIGNEKLDEDELKDQIELLETVNNNLFGIKASLESCIKSTTSMGSDVSGLYNAIADYNNIIQSNNKEIKELEEKIQKLYQIETQTNSLYSDAESLYSFVESGITAIKKSWDASVGEFNITGMDLVWKNEIHQVWKNKEEMLQEKYQPDFEDFLFQVFDPLAELSSNKLLSILKWYGANEYTFSLLRQGVKFNLNKVGNQYYVQLRGTIIDNCMPNKWENLENFLRNNIKDIDWDKNDIKKLVNKGWKFEKFTKNAIVYEDLKKTVGIHFNAKGNKTDILKLGFKEGLKEDIKCWKDLKIDKTFFQKPWRGTANVLGAMGTFSSAYENVKGNLFNEEGDFKPSWDGLQDTITDTGIDILAGTTSSAAGAAIGSLFLPPVGTAVGAVAGVVVDGILNFDIADVDGDGKKGSIVDGVKMIADGVCDYIGNKIENLF